MHNFDKFGVVGFGSVSKRHRRTLKKLFPHSIILGVSSSGRSPNSDNGLLNQVCPSIQQLIKESPKAVIICSPASHHSFHARPIIEAGIPFLIEKPVCMDLNDFDAL